MRIRIKAAAGRLGPPYLQMCGISALIGACPCCSQSRAWEQQAAACDAAAARRGPDASCSLTRPLGAGVLRLGAAVLHMRGVYACEQPALTTTEGSIVHDALCWNGEMFAGLDVPPGGSDTAAVAVALSLAGPGAGGIATALAPVLGPFALLYYCASEGALYAARDALGRRSLVFGASRPANDGQRSGAAMLFASVAPAADVSAGFHIHELPPGGVYRFQLSHARAASEGGVCYDAASQTVDVAPCVCSAGPRGSRDASPLRLLVGFAPWPATVWHRFDATIPRPLPPPPAARAGRIGTSAAPRWALRMLPAPRDVRALPPATDRVAALAALELLRRLSAAVRVRVAPETAVRVPVADSVALRSSPALCNGSTGSRPVFIAAGDAPRAAQIGVAAGGPPEAAPRDTVTAALRRVAAALLRSSDGRSDARGGESRAASEADAIASLPADALRAAADALRRLGDGSGVLRVAPQPIPLARAARVAVLYSGGVDSQLLARLAHEHVPPDETIDLINVDFDSAGASPDRASALAGVAELRAAAPTRAWQLICVDESYADGAAARAATLHDLLRPRCGHMDFNIAAALWHAARGVGFVDVDVIVEAGAGPVGSGCAAAASDTYSTTSAAAAVAAWSDAAAAASVSPVQPLSGPRLPAADRDVEAHTRFDGDGGRGRALPTVRVAFAGTSAPTDADVSCGAPPLAAVAASRHLRYATAAAAESRDDGDHKLSAYQLRRGQQPCDSIAGASVGRAQRVAGATQRKSPHDAVAAAATEAEINDALRGSVPWYRDGAGAEERAAAAADSLFELPPELRTTVDAIIATAYDVAPAADATRVIDVITAAAQRQLQSTDDDECATLAALMAVPSHLCLQGCGAAANGTDDPDDDGGDVGAGAAAGSCGAAAASIGTAASPDDPSATAAAPTSRRWKPAPRCAGSGDAANGRCGGDAARKCARRMCGPCCVATASNRAASVRDAATSDAGGHPLPPSPLHCAVHAGHRLTGCDTAPTAVEGAACAACAASPASASAAAGEDAAPQHHQPPLRIRVLVRSAARVLLSGIGADEQAGGYGRHRTAFAAAAPGGTRVGGAGGGTHLGGWSALRAELVRDCGRLWERNLGRDDRVCSDAGRELRQPFLDEGVTALLRRQLPLHLVCDPRLPHGVGDKRVVRAAARMAGLGASAALVKRAIHFGSRIAQQSNAAVFGSNRAARGGGARPHVVAAAAAAAAVPGAL